MADQPPHKRARRTDSSAMWESNEVSSGRSENSSKRDVQDTERVTRGGKEDGRRDNRSRSRERTDKPRRKDHSRERERDRNRDRKRDEPREKNRERNRPMERQHDRGERDDRDQKDRPRDRGHEGSRAQREDRMESEKHRTRTRSRSHSRTRGTSKPLPKHPSSSSHPPTPREGSKLAKSAITKMDIDPPGPPTKGKRAIEEVEDDPVAAEMRRMMGFAGFKSTKNTKVPGNDIYMVRKEKKTEYRQYMNRVGGFNRPLSPSR